MTRKFLHLAFALIVMAMAAAVAAAQDADAWRYAVVDPAVKSMRAAADEKARVLTLLPDGIQKRLSKEQGARDHVKLVLGLAGEQLVRAMRAASADEALVEINLYERIIIYTRLYLEGIQAERERDRKLMWKAFELNLREQIAILEQLEHDKNLPLEKIDPVIMRAQGYRVEMLNNIFGAPIVAPPQAGMRSND